MTIKKFFDRASWVVLAVLFIPAGLVLASKDAVPGDRMYSTKLALENVALALIRPSYAATSDFQMFVTKRRLAEVEQVVETQYAVEGLDNLNAQIIETSSSIGQVKKIVKQKELATKYIQTLKETQTSLKQQQKILSAPTHSTPTVSPPPSYSQHSPAKTSVKTKQPAAPIVEVTQTSPQPQRLVVQQPPAVIQKETPSTPDKPPAEVRVVPPPAEIQAKIEATQVEIEQKIIELEAVVQASDLEQTEENKSNHQQKTNTKHKGQDYEVKDRAQDKDDKKDKADKANENRTQTEKVKNNHSQKDSDD